MEKKLLVPNITFFNKNGEINYHMTEEHIDWLISNGVNGFFMTGTYGLGPLLNADECLRIYEICNKKSDENIAQINRNNLKETLELIEDAKNIGIKKFASVVPYYYSYSEKEIVEYFCKLKNISREKIFLYNNPKTTKFNIKPTLLDKLIEAGIDGLKDSSLNYAIISSALTQKERDASFNIMIGSSVGWNIFKTNKIDAMISGMCNYVPEIVKKVFELSQQGDNTEFNYAYNIMLEMNKKLSIYDSISLTFGALRNRKRLSLYTREPKNIFLKDEDYEYIEEVIKTAFIKLNLENEFLIK